MTTRFAALPMLCYNIGVLVIHSKLSSPKRIQCPILPDAGIFGSDDIVAIDQAVLDVTARSRLIEENIPTSMEVHTRQGHPFHWLHGSLKNPYHVTECGEQLGLGSRQHELVDVLPVKQITRAPIGYISAR